MARTTIPSLPAGAVFVGDPADIAPGSVDNITQVVRSIVGARHVTIASALGGHSGAQAWVATDPTGVARWFVKSGFGRITTEITEEAANHQIVAPRIACIPRLHGTAPVTRVDGEAGAVIVLDHLDQYTWYRTRPVPNRKATRALNLIGALNDQPVPATVQALNTQQIWEDIAHPERGVTAAINAGWVPASWIDRHLEELTTRIRTLRFDRLNHGDLTPLNIGFHRSGDLRIVDWRWLSAAPARLDHWMFRIFNAALANQPLLPEGDRIDEHDLAVISYLAIRWMHSAQFVNEWQKDRWWETNRRALVRTACTALTGTSPFF